MYFLALLILICVHISHGTPLEKNDPKCAELDKPGWKIDTLRNITLDAWPWNCLQQRYTNDTLKQLVQKSSSDIYDAVEHGFLGFVQYYVQKSDFPTDVDVPGFLRGVAATGNFRIFKYIVEEKRLPVDEKDWSLLVAAAIGGDVDLIKYLVNEKKLSTTSTINAANTPVHVAAGHGKFEALRFFVETLSLPLDSYNSYGDTPALLAALSGNVRELKYLIGRGANLDVRSAKNRTLLHEAAYCGSVEASKYLIEEKRASVDPTDDDGLTPAFVAAAGDRLLELKYLVEKGANLHLECDSNNQSILHKAVASGALRTTKYLVEEKKMSLDLRDAHDRTPLITAARNGRLELVKYLAGERKADLHVIDYFGLNLLHSAVAGKNLSVVRYLVDDMGMASHLEDQEVVGLTVALQAARYGSVPILEYLSNEKHVNMSAVDYLGNNLLHTAAKNFEFDTVKYLVERRGFDLRAKNVKDMTAFDILSKSKAKSKVKTDILEYLKLKQEQMK